MALNDGVITEELEAKGYRQIVSRKKFVGRGHTLYSEMRLSCGHLVTKPSYYAPKSIVRCKECLKTD